MNKLGDPFNGDLVNSPKRCKSLGYSGTFNSILVSASANFPEDDTTKTRFIINLPFVPHADLTTYPLIIKDTTTATVLSRVSGTPSANEYRLAPSTSERKNLIELHSGQAGHIIDFDGYSIASILVAEDFMSILNRSDKILLWWADYNNKYNMITGVTTANTAGAGTFTLPSGYSVFLEAIMSGGGGGGGSAGDRNESSTGTVGGGGGGGAGQIGITKFTYTSPVSYQIGIGGTGGAGKAASGTNSPGNNGVAGGNTFFGDILVTGGALGSAGAATSTTTGGAGGDGGATYSVGAIYGATSAAATSTTGGTGGAGGVGAAVGSAGGVGTVIELNKEFWSTSGGGGGGGGGYSTTIRQSGLGGGRNILAVTLTHGGGGGAGGDNCFGWGGTGGNGGTAGENATAWGTGGGGGGGNASIQDSLKGGDGSTGVILIYGYKSLI